MGRKNLLDSLMAPTAGVEARAKDATAEAPAPRRRGAVGAVGRSIADLRARAVVDLDPHTVEEDGPVDRLEEDADEEARLVASIREHGQQVPVLVRPHPERLDRWRIVYGRRRVLATREIGITVKALVRDLDDHAAVLAQGQENTHRRDLSFIERANFARQLRDLGYERVSIAEAVNVDKTLLSRFLSVADRVPVAVIHAIGAAPGVGRDRWLAFADLCADADWTPEAIAALAVEGTEQGGDNPPRQGSASDARFEAVFRALSRRNEPVIPNPMIVAPSLAERRPTPKAETVTIGDGSPLVTVRRGRRRVALDFPVEANTATSDFAEWLLSMLPELHRRWHEHTDRKDDSGSC